MTSNLAIGEVFRLYLGPQVLEERALGVEEVIPGGRPARVDDPDILPFLAEQPRHPDFRAEGIAVGPNMRRDQITVVGLDQVGQRGPVDAHVGTQRAGRDHPDILAEPEVLPQPGPTIDRDPVEPRKAARYDQIGQARLPCHPSHERLG